VDGGVLHQRHPVPLYRAADGDRGLDVVHQQLHRVHNLAPTLRVPCPNPLPAGGHQYGAVEPAGRADELAVILEAVDRPGLLGGEDQLVVGGLHDQHALFRHTLIIQPRRHLPDLLLGEALLEVLDLLCHFLPPSFGGCGEQVYHHPVRELRPGLDLPGARLGEELVVAGLVPQARAGAGAAEGGDIVEQHSLAGGLVVLRHPAHVPV